MALKVVLSSACKLKPLLQKGIGAAWNKALLLPCNRIKDAQDTGFHSWPKTLQVIFLCKEAQTVVHKAYDLPEKA